MKMNRDYVLFIETPLFEKNWKDLGFEDDDLMELQDTLSQDPHIGRLIKGTGGIRKMRFSFEGRGKSSSVRICYIYYHSYGCIFLVTAYSKKEKENLSLYKRNELRKLTKTLTEELKRRSSHDTL